MQIVLQLGILILGFVCLIKGADFFVEGASKVALKFGIPQIVIGLTIVAMGTSLPEAAVSIASATKGSADITIGNVVGSNIMNVLLILGLTAVICAIPVGKNTFRFELPFVIVISALIAGLGLFDGVISRVEGIILWVCMIAYLVYLRWRAKQGEELEEAPGADKERPMWLVVLMIFAGAGLIVLGSDLAVDAATKLAQMAGLSERIIGLTIIALGTSLPELVTSVTAARKGATDIAIGNIVGSNIFNILFVAGTTALITPVAYQANFLIDSIVMIGAVLLLWLCVLKDKKLGRLGGILMLAAYAGYFVYLCVG